LLRSNKAKQQKKENKAGFSKVRAAALLHG